MSDSLIDVFNHLPFMHRYYGQRYSSNPTCQTVQIKWESRVYGQITLPARSAFKSVPGTRPLNEWITCSQLSIAVFWWIHILILGVTVAWRLEAGANSISGSTGQNESEWSMTLLYASCIIYLVDQVYMYFLTYKVLYLASSSVRASSDQRGWPL